MTMDIRNLTPEQKQMILAAGKEGFSAEELRKLGLNRQIAEALYNSLAGEAEEVGDKTKFSREQEIEDLRAFDAKAKAKKEQYKKDAVAALKEGQYGEWLKNTWKYTNAPNGAFKEARSPLAFALPFVLALAATAVTSCGDFLKIPEADIYEVENGDEDKEKPSITVIPNTSATVNITIIKNGMSIEDFKAFYDSIMDKYQGPQIDYSQVLADILAELKALNLDLKSLSEIKILLQALNMDIDDVKKLLEQINKDLNDLKETCKTELERVNNNISTVITYLEEQGYLLADIIVALQANGIKLDEIITAMVESGKTLSGVYNLMLENNLANEKILEAMQTIIGQNTEVGKKLGTIIKLLEKGVTLDQETQNIVYKVLDAVYNLNNGSGNVDTTNIENALAAILDAITNLPTVDNVKEMNNETKAFLEKIVDLISALKDENSKKGDELAKLITSFMESFEKFASYEKSNDTELKTTIESFKKEIIDAINNLKNYFGTGSNAIDLTTIENMMAKMLEIMGSLPTADQLNENQRVMLSKVEDLTKLLNQFMENEANMDDKELELLKQILDKINNLKLETGDVTIDLSNLEAMMAILVDKVGNVEGGVTKLVELALAGNENIENLIKVVQAFKDDTKADLNDIKDLLKAVKDGVDKNGNTLLNIEEKLDIVNLTLKELKDQYPDLSAKLDEVIAKLGEILAKIPEGCDCNVDQILVKLEMIITELQKNPSNEGIVDDLDDLLK